ARGRTFLEEETQPGKACLAVLSYEQADKAASPIGATIRLDDAPCEVIGVMPKGFLFRDDRVKVWTALPLNTLDTIDNRQSHRWAAIARLREGASAEQADAQLQSVRAYWSEKYPDHYAKGHFAFSRPLREDFTGNQRDPLILLGGAVLFVLLIVCVNLA